MHSTMRQNGKWQNSWLFLTFLASSFAHSAEGGLTGGGGFAYRISAEEYRFVDSEEVVKSYQKLIRESGWTHNQKFWEFPVFAFRALINFGEVEDIREAVLSAIGAKDPALAKDLRENLKQLKWKSIRSASEIDLNFREPRPEGGPSTQAQSGLYSQKYRNKRVALQDRRSKTVYLLPEVNQFTNFEHALLQVHESYVASKRYDIQPATFEVISRKLTASLDYLIPHILQNSYRRLGQKNFQDALSSVFLDILFDSRSWGEKVPPSPTHNVATAYQKRWPFKTYEKKEYYNFIFKQQELLSHQLSDPNKEEVLLFKRSVASASYFFSFALMLSPMCKNSEDSLRGFSLSEGYQFVPGIRAFRLVDLSTTMLKKNVILQVYLANSPIFHYEDRGYSSKENFSFKAVLMDGFLKNHCF